MLTTLKITVSTLFRSIGNSSVIIVPDQPEISDVGFGIYRYGTMRELWDAAMRLLWRGKSTESCMKLEGAKWKIRAPIEDEKLGITIA